MVAEDIIVKNSKGQYDLTENGRKLNSKLLGRFKEDNHEENIRKVWSIKNILAEMENDVSYLEDIKTEKLNAEKERITRLKERLNEIYETLE
ncbi:MAG: hypothetical protein NKF70_13080 [Methanobacterium sp. ERen5]|nr:MAG: hypothetical protein NKF70_13080 [Methanobacterium sp. ERen5]